MRRECLLCKLDYGPLKRRCDECGGELITSLEATSKPRILSKPRRKREAAFQKRLAVALCQIEGVRVWRQNTGMVRTVGGGVFRAGPPRGAADLSGIVAPHGWRLEVEVKGEDTERHESPETLKAQRDWMEFIERSGGIYLKAHAELGVDAAVSMLCVLLRKRGHTV